jgi:predicted acylesterase/phospholipase RssA
MKTRQILRRMFATHGGRTTALLLLVLLPLCFGCAGHRPAKAQTQLLAWRKDRDAEYTQISQDLVRRMVQEVKARYDQHPGAPAVVDMLVISGGGDWGAFGAGFLKGWSRVRGPTAKPEFDAVTGVSTGALISPFAFLGDEESIDLIEALYRNPKPDWVKKRWPLYFLPSRQSFATVPGLERELRERLDMAMAHRIAEQSWRGRFLLVNTTDLDDGSMWVWNVGSESERAVATGDLERVRRILLASSGIPGAFPFRVIDGSLYVDGGVTGNILYGGRLRENQSIPAVWAATYPTLPVPKVRFWILFNNQLRPRPQVTAPTWPAVVKRSLELEIRFATLTSMRHLFAQAEIARLKHGGDFEVRIAAVPDDFTPPKPEAFAKETMNALADLGERMGADPASWRTEAP